MYYMQHQCEKCGTVCDIDGEFPKFFCYCDVCEDYAEGFDPMEFAADIWGSKIDEVYDRLRDK